MDWVTFAGHRSVSTWMDNLHTNACKCVSVCLQNIICETSQRYLHCNHVSKHKIFEIIPSSGLLRGVRWLKLTFRDYLSVPSSRVKLSSLTLWPLNVGEIGNPETSVLNHLTPCNNPEDGRINLNRSGSVRQPMDYILQYLQYADDCV
jgi:hypothetical protein